jgi:hypothetical protein
VRGCRTQTLFPLSALHSSVVVAEFAFFALVSGVFDRAAIAIAAGSRFCVNFIFSCITSTAQSIYTGFFVSQKTNTLLEAPMRLCIDCASSPSKEVFRAIRIFKLLDLLNQIMHDYQSCSG